MKDKQHHKKSHFPQQTSKPWHFIQPDSCKVQSYSPEGVYAQLHFNNDAKTPPCLVHIAPWSQQLQVTMMNPPHPPAVSFTLLGLETWRINHPPFSEVLMLPARLKAALLPFRGLWFPIAQLCTREPAALDLLDNNPVLLWMILYGCLYRGSIIRYYSSDRYPHYNLGHIHDKLKNYPVIDPVTVLHHKQPDIIGQLCGQPSKSAARLLRKVRLQHANEHEYLGLMSMLSSEYMQAFFRHWCPVPAYCLSTFANHPELMSLKFLRNYADLIAPFAKNTNSHSKPLTNTAVGFPDTERENSQQRLRDLLGLINDTKNMARIINRPTEEVIDVIVTSVSEAAIRRYHDRLIRERNHQHVDMDTTGWDDAMTVLSDGGMTFPPPPVTGCDIIHPIQNSDDLIAEGIYMEHCVASYQEQIEQGDCYVYRVLAPQRATLCISGQPPFSIIELQQANNLRVSKTTLLMVKKWLRGKL